MTAQDTFKFIDDLVTHAVTEAKSGNLTLLNRLGDNPAIAYYIDHVHFRQVWTQESWAQYRPGDFKEIEALQEAHAAAEKAKLSESATNSLAEKFDVLSSQLTEALAEIQALKADQSGKKPVKSIKEAEPTEPEPEADAHAETETEETTDAEETEVKADTEGK
jgi:hypothetical protein